MTRFFHWLFERFSTDKPAEESMLRRTTSLPRPRPVPKKTVAPKKVDFTAGISGRIVDGGPGKNVLIKGKYASEATGSHETLTIVDDLLANADDGDGIDPYNTGRFDRAKTWDATRFRK